jgi:hypothetical protein
VKFQALRAASLKMTAFYDIEPCCLVEVNRRFRDAYSAASIIRAMMKTVRTYETSVYFETTLRYIYSSGSIVSDYGLDDRAVGVRSPAAVRDFSSSLCVQTGSGAHPASCTMVTGGSFPRG